MKKRVFWVVCPIIFVVIMTVIIITYKQINKFEIPSIENINSIKVLPAQSGIQKNELVFDLNKEEHLHMVNNILNWLKSGKTMGKDKSKMFYHGISPTCLVIELKSGKQINILSAIDDVTINQDNVVCLYGQDVADQVTIYSDNKTPIRLLSPQLKSFINDGWKSFSFTKDKYIDASIYGDKSIRQILQLNSDQSIEYAGKYLDEKGIFNILLVFDSAKNITQDELQNRISKINEQGRIKILNAQYSLDILQSNFNIISDKLVDLTKCGINGVGISEKDNRITVRVKKIDEGVKEQIGKLVDNSLIQYEEGGAATIN